MNYSIEKNDLYSIIKPDAAIFNQDTCKKLRSKVQHEVESSSKYVIVNISSVNECNADGVRELIQLAIDLRDNNGMLIITHAEDQFTRLFNKADITFIPTDTEAIDFIFMDQLEKQFLDDHSA
ncbi:MAG: STAS domain-containing protein [Bacteroidota bacterium]|jgi:anti-anti-sigma regulatory factor